MKKVTTAIGAALLFTAAAAGLAPAAHAEPASPTATSQLAISQLAISQPAGQIIAQDQSAQLTAIASAPRAITVRTEPGAAVSVRPASAAARATKTLTKKADGQGIAAFTDLTAGQEYLVRSGGETITAVPVVPVGKTTKLTARATGDPTRVDLTWQHTATPARGGSAITYLVQATPIDPTTSRPQPNAETITVEVSTTRATLTGLDPAAVYEFSVRAKNPLGTGKASFARMSEPLASLERSPLNAAPATPQTMPKSNTDPAPSHEPAPAPNSGTNPAPQPGPSTRTVYVCPAGYQDAGANCVKTAPYTYTTRAYTYSDRVETSPYTYRTEVTGPAPIIDSFQTQDVCPGGYNLEDYGAQGKFCRLYGPVPTIQVKNAAPAGWTDNGTSYQRTVQVKDATPAGFTDDGTQWIKKDPAPSGWTDDGTQYVHTVAKEARTVPA